MGMPPERGSAARLIKNANAFVVYTDPDRYAIIVNTVKDSGQNGELKGERTKRGPASFR